MASILLAVERASKILFSIGGLRLVTTVTLYSYFTVCKNICYSLLASSRRKFVEQNLFSTAQVFEGKPHTPSWRKQTQSLVTTRHGLDLAGSVLILASTFIYANINLQFHSFQLRNYSNWTYWISPGTLCTLKSPMSELALSRTRSGEELERRPKQHHRSSRRSSYGL